ncbi:MAG: RMD1 family protein [Hyphomicrobiaceae bacterium]|nr:MAG: RMD1 family protein [Hyphomicrobiaceae bacterium]
MVKGYLREVSQVSNMSNRPLVARALQLSERIELKGLERADQFSSNPLGFKVAGGGTVVLFRFGAAVFFDMNPLEEEAIVDGLQGRLIEPLAERETETVQIILRPDGEDQTLPSGSIELKNAAPERLMLVAEALALSVALAYDERRIAQAFDRVEPIAFSLKRRSLLARSQAALMEQIGEALLIQQRLAGRVDMADRPDVLWDHPALERLWAKLADEYDLGPRARAIRQKLEVIRESADTMGDLLATRTSHRLEWYIIALIALEILLGLANRFVK